MTPRRRSPSRRDWPPYLYERRQSYFWRHPETRKEYPLGRIPLADAFKQAQEANAHLAKQRQTIAERLGKHRGPMPEVLRRKRHYPALSRGKLEDYCLYVVQAGEHVKVGITSQPALRLSQLRHANPLVKDFAFLSRKLPDAVRSETQAHVQLDQYHATGEWFRCDLDTALEAVARVLEAEE